MGSDPPVVTAAQRQPHQNALTLTIKGRRQHKGRLRPLGNFERRIKYKD